jgi:hypothetical protein
MTDSPKSTPARSISDAGRAAWDALRLAEKRLDEIDKQRAAALSEKDRLHAQMVRIGQQEGWHA